MLTTLPMLVQVVAIVIWASFFFLLVNAPLTGGARRGPDNFRSENNGTDPGPRGAERGRPPGWRGDRARSPRNQAT